MAFRRTTLKFLAALVGVLLISVVFVSNALAVRVIDVNTGQQVYLNNGDPVPTNANLRFEAEDGGTYDWYVDVVFPYPKPTLSSKTTGSSVTFAGDASQAGVSLQVSQQVGDTEAWSGYYKLVDPSDLPAPIMAEFPASGQLILPGVVGVYTPKRLLTLRVRGGPSSLPMASCRFGLRPGTRCFALDWAPLGPIEFVAEARGTAMGSPDGLQFPLTVASNAAPAFTRPVAQVAFRRKNGACQAQATVRLKAHESFVLQGEYRLEARMNGRWKQLFVKRQRVSGRADYYEQVLNSSASLESSAVRAAIGAQTKVRLRASFVVLSDGVAKTRSKDIKKSVNLRSCR